MTEILDILYKRRSLESRFLFGPKPIFASSEDWNRIRKLTRVADVNIGSVSYGSLRTEEEQAEVKAESILVSNEALDIYVGAYSFRKEFAPLVIESKGSELRQVLGDAVVRMLPMGNHVFKELELKTTIEFTVENGRVTQFTRRFNDMLEQQPDQIFTKIN